MKNPFPLCAAILLSTYPAVVVAEQLRLLPFTVVTFPTFIGFFTASAVLALVFSDYSRKAPNYNAPRVKARQPQNAPRPRSRPVGAAWAYHTVSP